MGHGGDRLRQPWSGCCTDGKAALALAWRAAVGTALRLIKEAWLSFLVPSTEVLNGCGGDRLLLAGSLKCGVWSRRRKSIEPQQKYLKEKFCL